MNKVIGIRGHRGAGKISISYLLANTIQFFRDKRDISEYDNEYNKWCDDLMNDENETVNNIDCENVYLESFGDGPKILVEMITCIPHEYIYSDYYKDHVVISLKDLSYQVVEDMDEFERKYPLWSAQLLTEYVDINNPDTLSDRNYYMLLREFIIYYASATARYMGKDIWVKLMRAENKMYPDDRRFRIFVDLKAPSEIDYIVELGGLIIKVERPSHIKRNGLDLLKNDNRYDIKINVKGSLYDLKDQILEICQRILEK